MMQLGVSYDPPAWRTAQLSQPRRSRRAPARGARTGVSQPSAVLRPNTRVKIVQRGETSPEEISRRSLIAAAAAACGCCASSVVTGGKIPGSSSDDSAKTWSQPLFAEEMAKGMRDYEARLRPLKCALFTGGQDDQQSPSTPPGLAGAPQLQPAPAGGLIAPGSRVLEIGVGAAPNFRYYSSASSVTALEPNEAFYPLIRDAAAANGLADRLRLVPGTAEKMPFDSGSFDVVVGAPSRLGGWRCWDLACGATGVPTAVPPPAPRPRPALRSAADVADVCQCRAASLGRCQTRLTAPLATTKDIIIIARLLPLLFPHAPPPLRPRPPAATMVLCSCADVRAVAREVRRVLRPGGVFASVEHVAAPRWTPLWALQARTEEDDGAARASLLRVSGACVCCAAGRLYFYSSVLSLAPPRSPRWCSMDAEAPLRIHHLMPRAPTAPRILTAASH